MTNYKFGDILLVPFPFTDQTSAKQRPAVVVSSTAYNLTRLDVVLMAITSQIRLPVKSDELEIVDWQNSGLLKSSLIKPVLTTIEKSLVLKKLGSLSREDKDRVKDLLFTILG